MHKFVCMVKWIEMELQDYDKIWRITIVDNYEINGFRWNSVYSVNN